MTALLAAGAQDRWISDTTGLDPETRFACFGLGAYLGETGVRDSVNDLAIAHKTICSFFSVGADRVPARLPTGSTMDWLHLTTKVVVAAARGDVSPQSAELAALIVANGYIVATRVLSGGARSRFRYFVIHFDRRRQEPRNIALPSEDELIRISDLRERDRAMGGC